MLKYLFREPHTFCDLRDLYIPGQSPGTTVQATTFID